MNNCIRIGNKVEILTDLDEKGEQKHYYTNIQDIDGNEITILAPIIKGRIEPLEIDRVYGMCIYGDRGLYRCEVVVTSREKKNKLFLIKLQVESRVEKYQRRQFYRMDCVMSFHYKDDIENNWYEGTILDISGGGLRFSTNERISESKSLVNHLRLEINGSCDEVFLNGEIVQCNLSDSDPNTYEIREKFSEITENERDIIIKYIFDEERRRRSGKSK